jgi:hypothetical protein
VPVVGQDLLVLPFEGRDVPLYVLLAERLAAKLRVEDASLPREGALDAVAYSYLAGGGNVQYLYSSLKSVMPPLEELPLPPALRKLARIGKLRLFITTTFDSLLERALNEERFAGRKGTEVFPYSPGAADPGDIGDREGPVVLHLFGKLSALSSEYALTEEDKLEFVHSLQSEGGRPRVLDELSERPLLVLGNGFSDWLARFFLRIGSGTRLSARRGKTDVFADRVLGAEPGLRLFLRHFGSGIQVLEGEASEFVDELYSRWSAAHPEGPAVGETAPGETARAARVEAPAGAIFLSYASEDLIAARALRDALAAKNMEVWFDKEALLAGDDFRLRIRRGIQGSCLFVPVISRHTLTSAARFFRREWTEAVDLLAEMPANRTFILPVAIDDVSEREEALPETFRNFHWTRLPQGLADERFVEHVRELYRKHQQARKGP